MIRFDQHINHSLQICKDHAQLCAVLASEMAPRLSGHLLDSAAMLPRDWGRESGASSAWQSPPPANVHIQTNARIQITKYKGKEMLVICLMDLWKTKIKVDVAITRYIV